MEIPFANSNAIDGAWADGPGDKLINTLYKNVQNLNIIAEDLGELSNESLAYGKLKIFLVCKYCNSL